MRSPTPAPAAAIKGAAARALSNEVLRGHAVAIGENMDIAGLGRLQLGFAGGDEGLGDIVG